METWKISQTVDLACVSSGRCTSLTAPMMEAGDAQAHTWQLTVLNRGKAANLSGLRAVGYFLRPDGVTVAVTGAVSDNVITVVLAAPCYACAGSVRGFLRLTDGDGQVVTLSALSMYVGKGVGELVLDTSGELLPDLATMQQALASVSETLDGLSRLHAQDTAALSARVEGLAATVRAPLTATAAADMTDTDKVYVYTGAESGYIHGNWYYYDGASWASGGVYNALALTTDASLSASGAAADASAVGRALTALDAEKLDKILGANLFNKDDPDVVENAFIQANGQQRTNAYSSAYFASGWIPAEPGVAYTLTPNNTSNTCLCFYASDKSTVTGYCQYDTNGGSANLVAPANTAYLRFSGWVAQKDTTMLEIGESASGVYTEYTEYEPLRAAEARVSRLEKGQGLAWSPAVATADSLASGGTLTVPYDSIPDLRENYALSFHADVTTFSGLRIARNAGYYASIYLDIDEDNLTVRSEAGENLRGTYAHGLTIEGFLTVLVNVRRNGTADITLTTLGGSFTQTGVWWWERVKGAVVATSNGSTLTNCALSYAPCDIDRAKLWIFGDSYPDYWKSYAEAFGYTNCVYDGYSGRGGGDALTSLRKLLAIGKPSKVFWAIGMNNPDSGAIHATWKTSFDAALALCEANGIEFIGYITPSTPERDHTYKNAYVKEKCTRYVDIAQAVGADASTAWRTGLLSSDNVHPTGQGSMVIAARICAEIPEMKGI